MDVIDTTTNTAGHQGKRMLMSVKTGWRMERAGKSGG
jgi:hypothetical protein